MLTKVDLAEEREVAKSPIAPFGHDHINDFIVGWHYPAIREQSLEAGGARADLLADGRAVISVINQQFGRDVALTKGICQNSGLEPYRGMLEGEKSTPSESEGGRREARNAVLAAPKP